MSCAEDLWLRYFGKIGLDEVVPSAIASLSTDEESIKGQNPWHLYTYLAISRFSRELAEATRMQHMASAAA